MGTLRSKKKKFGSSLPTNLKIGTDLIKIYVKNKQIFEQMQKNIVPSENKETSIGTGIFKYEGFSWDNGTIFIGFCPKLESGLLQFTGLNASVNFENFEKTYLSKMDRTTLSAISFGTTISCAITLSDNWSEEETPSKFQRILEQQQKKQPKFSITDDGLTIGSKSTETFVVFVPLSTNNGVVTKVQVVAKMTKDFSILEFFLANPESTFEDKIASSLLQFLSKLTVSGFLVDVKTSFIDNHNIGKINEKKSTTVLTKDGRTVQRSLSAVRNKLVSSTTQAEAKEILFTWLGSIEVLFRNDETFQKTISKLSSAQKQSSSIRSDASGSVVQVSVVSPETGETSAEAEETSAEAGASTENTTRRRSRRMEE